MPAFRISCYTRISYLDISDVEMMFRPKLLSSSSRLKREKKLRECNWTPTVPVFSCEIFRQFTRNFRRGRLSSRDLCWLVVKFPSPRRYEKVIRRTSICLETLEKLPDERVTEWWGSMGLYGLGRELVMKICMQDVEWWNFHLPFVGFLEWFNFDSVQIWKPSRCGT